MAKKQVVPETASSVIPHWYSPDDETASVAEADGIRVTDERGRDYIDFVSQLYCVNAGHGNEAIIGAMTDQLETVQYVSPSSDVAVRDRLADRLVEVAPSSLTGVFFSISGSEANESAAQLAREYTGGRKILTRWRSYHGSTYGAASFTGAPGTRNATGQYAEPSGSAKFLPPVSYQGPFDADSPAELADRAAEHLDFVIRNEGPDSVAAVLTEVVGGASGAFTAPPGYFERVREVCDRHDVLLIADEVITGFGRCGDWFGAQTEGVEPDMITFAKGVTSAYAPLAGVLASEEIRAHVEEEGYGLGQTFAGHPVACAAGVAALEEYEGGLIENVRDVEPVLESRLAALEAEYDVVGDVRGRGFLWAVEFTDPETGEPFVEMPVGEDEQNPVDDVTKAAKDHGLLVSGGRPAYHVMLSPPLVATGADVHEAVDRLEAAITDVFE
jgi:taurine--2-oxoglutarate transaminase